MFDNYFFQDSNFTNNRKLLPINRNLITFDEVKTRRKLMKKLAIATIGLAVLSTSAFASKARLEALGQNVFGSQYLDDNRNVFLNPAHLNTHYDWITMEWGNTNKAYTGTSADNAAGPKAEGGMFKNTGNMIYGLYFGSESDVSQNLRKGAGLADAVAEETNNLDLFIAGDAGVQWGVRLTHGAYEDEANDHESTATRMTVGVVSGNIDTFLNFGLANKADDGTNEFDGAGSIDFGITYGMGDMDIYARYSTISAEDANEDEYTRSDTTLGVAKTYKLNDKANAWASAYYTMSSTENDFAASGAPGESKSNYLPVVIGLEVMAKEWLTLRGSVVHEVIGTDEADNGDKSTRADTTTVNAGASLIFGDLTIDGLIGNSTDGDNASGNSTASGNGNLRTDNIMSRVSMTYKF